MFKFSTTTLLNGATPEKLVLTQEGNVMVSDAWRSEDFDNAKIVALEPTDEVPGYLAIERLGKFSSDAVTKIYHREANPGVAGKVELTVKLTDEFSSYNEKEATEAGIYRLNLYVRLGEGSQNSNFANVWVFKGKPLAYEFELTRAMVKAGKGAADVAKGLADRVKFEAVRFGSKHIKATADGETLTIEAIGPDKNYQFFAVAELQKFNSELDTALIGGEYETISVEEDVVNTMCEYPFGTYDEILKDLRLPTLEHTSWATIQPDEMPAFGQTYDQFMIYMCKDRGIMGGDAVGEVTKSVTAHSIWVPSAAAADFQTLLETYTGVTVEEFDAEYEAQAGHADDHGKKFSEEVDHTDDVAKISSEKDMAVVTE